VRFDCLTTKLTCPVLPGRGNRFYQKPRPAAPGQVERLGTPGMACDLWGESPLDENEDLKVGSIPTVTPIDKVLEARNCGRATDRGKEATSQSCEVTDRNPIQGRCGPASEPAIAKPSSFIRIGKLGACAAKAMRLIQGDPPHVSATQACLHAEPTSVNGAGVRRKSAEAVVLFRRIPPMTGRAKP
jgi:hypothetical protein